MKKFSFRLDKLMEIKKNDVRTRELEMMRLLGQIRDKERELDAVIAEIADLKGGKPKSKIVTAAELQQMNKYMSLLEEKSSSLKIALEQLNNIFAKVKTEYIEIRKELLVLEKLHSRRRAEYMKELDKEEQKFVNEISATHLVNGLNNKNESRNYEKN